MIPAIKSLPIEISPMLAKRTAKPLGGIIIAKPPLPKTAPILIGFL
jgi:hypothetical protein